MKNPSFASVTLPLALAVSLFAGGCSKQAPQQAQNPNQPNAQQNPQQSPQIAPNAPAQQAVNPGSASPVQQAPAPQAGSGYAQAPPRPVSYVIPAGSHLVVTTHEALSTKTAQPGETFTATITAPVVVRGATLIRAGSSATGTVIDSKSPGRFKGAGTISIRLDSVRVDGRTYQVATSAYTQDVKGKGKRTAVLAGGGGGLGALIGGLAGGGKGAVIGGLAGAGAGTTGAAFTGNKELEIPSESRVTFRLTQSLTVNR